MNTLLDQDDRVLLIDRQWLYRVEVPYFYAHPDLQNEIKLRANNTDPALFMAQLDDKLITHVVALPSDLDGLGNNSPLQNFIETLHSKACARIIHTLDVPRWASRTLKPSTQQTQVFLIYKMTPDTCDLK